MAHEPLSPTDATFLHIESDHEPQHVGSLSVLEGSPLRDADGRVRIEELRARIEGRLHSVPRLRQRVRFVPVALGPPVWVDDHDFDIEYHVRLTALPRPGDPRQLDELMGRLQSIPLDRRRPLWELWFVDGLEQERVGLIIKTHHALGDGIANVDLAIALVDTEADPAPEQPAPAWRARPGPSSTRLFAEGALARATEPLKLIGIAADAVRHPRHAVRAVTDTARTIVGFTARTSPVSWNREVGPHRRWSRTAVPMEVVRSIRDRHEATLNDVVLAVCAGSLRDYLALREPGVAPESLKAMVPVSRRAEDEHGAELGNKVSLIVVDLPVEEADPVTRLRRIHRQTVELKGSGLADGAEHVVDLAAHAPMLAGPMARLLSRRIPMNLVITNVPGPPTTLYLGGGRIHEAYPYVEVIDGEGLVIAVLSYEDTLFFGLTSDRDLVPDLQSLADGIVDGIQTLARR